MLILYVMLSRVTPEEARKQLRERRRRRYWLNARNLLALIT